MSVVVLAKLALVGVLLVANTAVSLAILEAIETACREYRVGGEWQ